MPSSASPLERPHGLLVLLRTRFVLVFTISKIFLDPAWYFYIFWSPEYLRRARDFDIAAIGKYAWIPFAVAGVGNLLGGWLAAAMIRRNLGVSTTRKICVAVFAGLMATAIPAVFTGSAGVAIAFVSLAMMGYTACSANMLAIPADAFPRSAVSTVYGLASMGSGFGGMVFSLLTGWAIDRFSYAPVFVGFGLMPLACALILWKGLGPIHPAAVEVQLNEKLGRTYACTQ